MNNATACTCTTRRVADKFNPTVVIRSLDCPVDFHRQLAEVAQGYRSGRYQASGGIGFGSIATRS